jgi:hypothetical protein
MSCAKTARKGDDSRLLFLMARGKMTPRRCAWLAWRRVHAALIRMADVAARGGLGLGADLPTSFSVSSLHFCFVLVRPRDSFVLGEVTAQKKQRLCQLHKQ